MNLRDNSEEFAAAVNAATRENGFRDAGIVEKDYFIAESLRRVATFFGPKQVIFKGGTSLSLAWRMTERLSEDIDLLIVKSKFEPPLSNRKTDEKLLELCEFVSDSAPVEYFDSKVYGGTRKDFFRYESVIPDTSIPTTIMLEPGHKGGSFPMESLPIRSMLSRFVESTSTASFDDLEPFDIEVLRYERTYVEKLFAVHGLVERLKSSGELLERDARHYLDLVTLNRRDDIKAFVRSEEYGKLCEICDKFGADLYRDTHVAPEGLRFSASDALFPDEDLQRLIEPDYVAQGQTLSFADFPPFSEVVESFEELRESI